MTRPPLQLAPLLCLLACGGEPAQAPLPPLPPKVEASGLGAPGPVEPLREAVIALTGEVRGEIEPCGCPTVPYGGFARRAALLDAVRAEGIPVFVLDAGEMVMRGQVAADPGDRPQRARAVLDLALGTGLDAWAPGAVDLEPGGLRLLAGTQALSANWRDSGGQPVFPASTVVERDGFRLGVVGLGGRTDALKSEDPVAVTRAAIAAGGPADAWVALSNLSAEDARRVAEGVPGLGAVLSVRNGEHDAPLATSGAPIIETPDRGRYVTLVRLALATAPGPWKVGDGGVYADLAEERGRQARLPTEARDGTKRDALHARMEKEVAGHAVAYVEDRPLGSDLDPAAPPAIEARITSFKDASTTSAKNRVASKPPVAGYATANGCVVCHSDHFAAWSLTEHARAFEALIPRHAEANPECVACHSTGWGEPGGFADLSPAALRTWKAVQCEACHGPLAGHPDQGTPARPITKETCTRCHDVANSPTFDYDKYLPRTSCVMVAKQEQDEQR